MKRAGEPMSFGKCMGHRPLAGAASTKARKVRDVTELNADTALAEAVR